MALPDLIDTADFPDVLRTMFRCRKCGYWFDDDLRGPEDRCQSCDWGVAPDMNRAITREMVILDLVQMAERLQSYEW
jgi:hypothetical protein